MQEKQPKHFIWLFLFLILNGCFQNKTPPTPDSHDPLQSLVERGKVVYQTQCTACHSSQPQKPGVLGPEVFGASRELLEARILRAEYPPGYQPKRQTHSMVPLPHLKNDLEAIYSYLNSARP